MSLRRMPASFFLGLGILTAGLWLGAPGVPADPPSPPPEKASAPSGDEAKPEIMNSIGMPLRLIRAGNFRMGSPDAEKEASADEKPQHRVWIKKPFYLGKCEVTRGEFQKFVTATSYKTEAEKDSQGGWGYTGNPSDAFAQKPEYTWRNPGYDQTDSHPVVNVRWNDAFAFCQWLSKQEGVTYRLPTEAEWEWACRAGTIERWNCGDEEAALERNVNLADATLKPKWIGASWTMSWDDAFPFTSPVGKFKANKFGLHDMHGNVWEWCSDWYDPNYYARSPINDPHGPESGESRVYRGGGWGNWPKFCRSAMRGGYSPSYRSSYVGFRVARSPTVQ